MSDKPLKAVPPSYFHNATKMATRMIYRLIHGLEARSYLELEWLAEQLEELAKDARNQSLTLEAKNNDANKTYRRQG